MLPLYLESSTSIDTLPSAGASCRACGRVLWGIARRKVAAAGVVVDDAGRAYSADDMIRLTEDQLSKCNEAPGGVAGGGRVTKTSTRSGTRRRHAAAELKRILVLMEQSRDCFHVYYTVLYCTVQYRFPSPRSRTVLHNATDTRAMIWCSRRVSLLPPRPPQRGNRNPNVPDSE